MQLNLSWLYMQNWSYPETANAPSTRRAEDTVRSRCDRAGQLGYFNNSEEGCKESTVLTSENSGGLLPEDSC